MKLLNPNTRVVVLTGAGISAESGIRTFRAADGLWEEHRIEDVATPEGWRRNPELVWSFYQGRRRQLLDVVPNPAHDALVNLEEYLDENLLLVTQNVDDLHSRAGSNNLLHMHGELRKLRCESCEVIVEAMEGVHLQDDFIGCRECQSGRLRPHIVWFTEVPFEMEKINAAVFECDVFIAIGTSGHVYPAAGLLTIARLQGAYCIGVNLDPPENVDFFDEFHQGHAGELLPDLVGRWVGDEER